MLVAVLYHLVVKLLEFRKARCPIDSQWTAIWKPSISPCMCHISEPYDACIPTKYLRAHPFKQALLFSTIQYMVIWPFWRSFSTGDHNFANWQTVNSKKLTRFDFLSLWANWRLSRTYAIILPKSSNLAALMNPSRFVFSFWQPNYRILLFWLSIYRIL